MEKSGEGLFVGWAVACSWKNDTLVLKDPPYKGGCTPDAVFSAAESDSLWLKVYNGGECFIPRSYFPQPLYLDGELYDTLRRDYVDSIRVPNKKYDSLRIDGTPVPLQDHVKGQNITVTLWCYPGDTKMVETDGFPNHYDSLRLAWQGDHWMPVPDPNPHGYDLTWFERLIPRLWESDWRGNIMEIGKEHRFIPKSEVISLRVKLENTKAIDLREYTGLKDLYVITKQPAINIVANGTLNQVEIETDTLLPGIDLTLLGQHKIYELNTNIPVKRTNIKKVGWYRTGIYKTSHESVLSASSFSFRKLCLNYRNDRPVYILDSWKGLEYLLIEKDTIQITGSIRGILDLDTLILYGRASSYDFLKRLPNLKYLGVYCLDEDVFPAIAPQYPELEYQYWCFPEGSMVQAGVDISIPIENLCTGDSVLCITPNGKLSKTVITGIEFHPDVKTILYYVSQNAFTASVSQYPLLACMAAFTWRHPLMTMEKGKTVSELKETDFLYTLQNGWMPFYQCKLVPKKFSGTLVNIKTAAGNYFVNGFTFMNK